MSGVNNLKIIFIQQQNNPKTIFDHDPETIKMRENDIVI